MSNLHKSFSNEEFLDVDAKDMQTLFKLVSYNSKEFHHRWAIMILVANLYNFFTVTYFLGMSDFPKGVWLGLNLISEILLFLDMAARVVLSRTSTWKRMWMLHENLGVFYWVFIGLSSLPYTFILHVAGLANTGFRYFKAFKLLRIVQVSTFFTNQKIVLRWTSTVEVVKLFLIILGITHFAGTLWLVIGSLEIEFGSKSWLTPWIDKSASQFEIYIDACFWATSTLTSIGFGDLIPATNIERLFSILVMVVGASTYAALFGLLVVMLIEKNRTEVETQQRLERAKQWCQTRKMPDEIKFRIFTFYTLIYRKFRHQMDYGFVNELPLSLKTEISLFIHKNMVPKVKLFELGDPTFMLGIIRYLRPKLYIAGDMIVRKGEYADEMYFIKVGAVEVLADDNESIIAYLEEGAFFGEIGIFLKGTRSVSVRAQTATLISSITKQHLFLILKNFPEYKQLLIRIAEQRLSTTSVDEIDMNYDIEEDPRILKSELSQMLTIKSVKGQKSMLQRMITVRENKSKDEQYIIDSLSPFYYIWACLILSSYSFYLFYVPLTICFEVGPNWFLVGLDVACYTIYIIDIFVNANTASMTSYGVLERELREIRKTYLNDYLILDICSLIPVDFGLTIFHYKVYPTVYFRFFRFLKYRRAYNIIQTIQTHATYSLSLLRLFQYFVYFVLFSHISACLFHSFVVIQSNLEFDSRFDNRNFLNVFSEQSYQNYDPFLSLSVYEQYIHMLYWSFSITGTGAYGDIVAVTIGEKIFNMIVMILSKCFIAFIYAEAATIMTNASRPYTDHLGKLGSIKSWLLHIKASRGIIRRVKNYYNLLWSKMGGHEDDEIIQDLPESLVVDIKAHLFDGLVSNEYFPTEEPGPLLSILKKCKIIIVCKDETIIEEGDIGLEMYFIVEGEAEVISSTGIPLNVIKKGMVFGEMALLKSAPAVRGATVRAKTDITLAVLSLDDFIFVMDLYPDFAFQVRVQAANRERMNRVTLQKASIKALIKHRTKSAELNDYPYLETSEMIPVTHPRKHYFKKIYKSKLPQCLYFLIWTWSIVFIPYQIAFRGKFSGWVLALEVSSILLYLLFALYYFCVYRLISKSSYTLFRAAHHIVIAVPFALIFESYDNNSYTVMFLSLLRISNYYALFDFFNYMKQRMILFNLTRILQVMCIYFTVSHINACLFINIGLKEDPSWLSRVPSPKTEGSELTEITVYIHAMYWSIVTISHIGTGDLTPISVLERAYTCLAFLLGCFIYAILFGNITSLVSAFASHLRSKLQDSYAFTVNFLHKKNLHGLFLRRVNEYFNFLWYENKGLNEQSMLDHLPSSLVTDIQLHRYAVAVHNLTFFSLPLIRSMFRVMETRYYLIGDTVVHAGDKNLEFYIVLDGEVQVIDFEGKRVIATISAGGYFGEANLLFNWKARTANVVAISICKLGVVPSDKFRILLNCYPDWHEALLETATARMKEAFSEEDLELVARQMEEIRDVLNEDPDYTTKTKKNTNKLVALKIATLLKDPPQNRWFALSLAHLGLLIYSGFAIPLQIGFNLEMSFGLLMMEGLCVFESLIFFLVNCRYSVIVDARNELEFRDIISYYYHHFLFEDLVAISPFNLLFPLFGVTEVMPLRLLRLMALLRIPSLIEKIEVYSRPLSSLLNKFKAILLLIFLTHWSSCLWFYAAQDWDSYFSISSRTLGEQYLYVVYYTMNIVTSLGYGDLYPTTDRERMVTIFIIFLGDALFAVAFGLMANIASSKKSEFSEFLQNLKTPYNVLHKTKVPRSIIKRLEAYYGFNAVLDRTYGPIDYRCLNEHLPRSIVSSIIYECTKDILKSLPLLAQANSEDLIEKISVLLTPRIFFPDDYVIYKNDVGEEMYFIIEGCVNVLSQDGKRVIRTLGKGSYVGELALISSSKRLCSVVAANLCVMHALHKSDFKKILKRFPEVYEEIYMEAEKRRKETADLANFDISFHNEDKLGIEHKRRPHISMRHERRLSQVSLGKEIVLSKYSKLKMQWTVQGNK